MKLLNRQTVDPSWLYRNSREPEGLPKDSVERLPAHAEKAKQQAAELRTFADILEYTEVPFIGVVFEPSLRDPSGMDDLDDDQKRAVARDQVQWTNKLMRKFFPRQDRSRKVNDWEWGLKMTTPSGFTFRRTVSNTETCKQTPVLDDEGAPVMETVSISKFVEVEVTQAKTEKECMSLFAKDGEE